MLEVTFLKEVFELLTDKQTEIKIEALFAGGTIDVAVNEIKDNYEIEKITIELSLSVLADFNTHLYCEYVVKSYGDLTLAWDFHNIILILTQAVEIDYIEAFFDEVDSFNETIKRQQVE